MVQNIQQCTIGLGSLSGFGQVADMGVVEERHCNGGDLTRKVRMYSDHKVAGAR